MKQLLHQSQMSTSSKFVDLASAQKWAILADLCLNHLVDIGIARGTRGDRTG